jgi:septal ring factor EnvC (AmiA/AmiB activator)
MLDIFNRKAKQENEELRKQIQELESENLGLNAYKSSTKYSISKLENEIKIKEGALGISIKAGVEKDKEIAKLKNWIKEIRKKENEEKRKLLHDVVAIDRENKQLREEIEELKSARFERTKATYNALRDEYKDKINVNKITVTQQQRVFGITPQNIETFRMLRGMALNGRNKRIRNKYINKMADSMEAVFKVLEEAE